MNTSQTQVQPCFRIWFVVREVIPHGNPSESNRSCTRTFLRPSQQQKAAHRSHPPPDNQNECWIHCALIYDSAERKCSQVLGIRKALTSVQAVLCKNKHLSSMRVSYHPSLVRDDLTLTFEPL